MRKNVLQQLTRQAKAVLFLLALALIALSIGCAEKPRIEWENNIDTALARAKELRRR